jgi:hypothetical protein
LRAYKIDIYRSTVRDYIVGGNILKEITLAFGRTIFIIYIPTIT